MTKQILMRTFIVGFVPMIGGTLARFLVQNSILDWVLLLVVMLGAFVSSFGAGMLAKDTK